MCVTIVGVVKMGDPSFFDWEDVEIKDLDGLKKYLADLKAGKYDGRTPTKPEKGCGETVEISKDGTTLSFEGMDDWKIISYWYENFVCFMRDVAIFIEGEVHWTFQNNDLGGYVEFRDGELTIHCGEMQWSEYTAEEMCEPQKGFRKGIDELPEELKLRLAARKI